MTDSPEPVQPHTFAEHVLAYAQTGWPCVIPVPADEKFPPPVGFTGAEGRDTDALQLVAWAGSHPTSSIALRMPDGVIGIDVDQYVKKGVQKRGAETLAACVERWGPLPATWTSTAREPDGPSRVHFFRVPPGRYATKLTGPTSGDVEIIQRHHRYAVVWPSPHHDIGSIYRWYDPAGVGVDAPPKPDELAELPPSWVAGLLEGATLAGPASASHSAGEALLDQLLDDHRPECAEIFSARLQAADELGRADSGSRHDTMTARIHHLVQLAALGHPGVSYAVTELRMAWDALTAGENRGEELERMLLTSARKAVTAVGQVQPPRDPCLYEHAASVPAPHPGGSGEGEDGGAGDPTEPIAPPRWWSVREFIGAAAFDPNAGLDQTLAEKVLERTWPVLRYTYDSGAWLLRMPEQWEPHKDMAGWAVSQVAQLMPVGDPTADKESEQYDRSQRRARLMTSAGASGVAKKMSTLVAGGVHPAALRLADLDSDPEVLWAGGRPWSLRASLTEPVVAGIDLATPHLHAAGVAPEVRPTPLFDAFLDAVWPDPELRDWAVRVLSIAVTGYADRALPILLGETGRGKTQLVHLLMSVLGSYAHAANPKLLVAGSNEHDTIVYALKGRRLSFIDEAPSESKAGQERLKQLTGGGELTARQMNENPITFSPTHTFVLTANPESEPVLTDPAVRARARLIPCEGDPEEVRRTRAAIGPTSSAAWRAEAPGVLARVMAEASAWLADPTTASTHAAPEAIRYLAEHLGAEQDPVSVWVAEETEPYDEGTPSRELYQAFTASCLRNNLRRDAIPSETRWGRALNRLGYGSVHTEHGKRRRLRLRMGGGYLPVVGLPPTGAAVQADGLTPSADGFLTGSQTNPSATNAQVNPSVQPNPDGLTGSSSPYVHAQAHAGAQGPDQNNPSTRQRELAETHSDLGKQAPDGLGEAYDAAPEPARTTAKPAKSPRKPKDPEVEARAATKRAQAAAEKRAAAVTQAAGAMVPLPALVLRNGSTRTVTAADADTLLATITAGDAPLTLDVEHTGYPVGHQDYRLRTVQLGGEDFAFVLDPEQPDQADVVRRHLEAATVLHAHSASADLVPTAAAGLVDADAAWAKMLDTGLLAKLSDPASTGNDADLKNLAKNVLGAAALSPAAEEGRKVLFTAGKWLTDVEVTTAVERSGWAQSDPASETMVRYAASDVLDDAALARLLPRPAPEVLEREQVAQQMTARVSHHGIRLDAEHVRRLRDEHVQARTERAERVRAFGIDNPGSPAQVATALEALGVQLPRTKAGKPSVAKGAIEPMKDLEGPVGDLAREVLAYRHHNTALVLLLEPYHELCVRGDGRARPTIYTLGADTGRMSSSRPNVQQVSREGGMRACFTADPGHLLISADFSGVELRVAAALSQDANLMAIVADPARDIHREIAQIVWGQGAGKAERYQAKRKVFGRIYGSGLNGLVTADPPVSPAIAQAIIDAMDLMTPGLSRWSSDVADGIAAGRTKFQAYSGRVIHLPVAAAHAAGNYCIQGTARELLIDALLRWRETRWGECVLFPVHDELVVMVPEDEAAEATAELERCMTSELYGVSIIAEASEPSFAWRDSV